ncbi:MAG: aspartate aminotransferase family protein [Bradymonadales bacterium]|nr:aspartate aminotransferase family protein [Bradymonadales bacterium]
MIPKTEKQAIAARFARHLSRGQVAYLRAGHLDVLETARRGIGFVDGGTGRSMIDAFTSAGCFNVGRGNPRVLAALREALHTWDMGTPGVDSAPRRALRARLAEIAPGDLDRVLLCAGGGDAVDAALKLARGATGRPEILAATKAYHGHTGFALSVNGKAHYRDYCEPLMPAVRFAPFNDLEEARRQVGPNTAAILVEPVQGEAGIYPAAPGYLEGLRGLCDETGALLVADEIQTGFGRTGRLFACEHAGVVPDLMTVAKSLGGGVYPVAALLWREVEPLASWTAAHPDFHRTTGGSELGCATALAAIDEVLDRRLWENAAARGEELMAALSDLARQNSRIVREVRGLGLMVGIEYIHEFLGPMMSDALARRGVFAAYSGNAPQVMRFMIPLTATQDEVKELAEAIAGAVGDMRKLLPLALPAARVPALRRLLNDEGAQIRLFGALRSMEDLLARVRRRRK